MTGTFSVNSPYDLYHIHFTSISEELRLANKSLVDGHSK